MCLIYFRDAPAKAIVGFYYSAVSNVIATREKKIDYYSLKTQ